jgi:predicted choloylglycine hydrolase
MYKKTFTKESETSYKDENGVIDFQRKDGGTSLNEFKILPTQFCGHNVYQKDNGNLFIKNQDYWKNVD